MSIQKSEIQLKVNDQTASAYLASPENGGPGILVLHAWWGLKPFFKQVCDQLAEHGFVAFAPDLYRGRVATTIEEAKTYHTEFEQNGSELMGDTVKAAKNYLSSLYAGKPIGVMGFSMGAAWSIIVATHEPDISTMVLFYGAYAPDFSQMKTKVLGHFAEVDEWEPLDGVKEMEKAMQAAGVDVTVHIYPNVGHWFVESDRPEYDPSAAAIAWDRTFEFLKKNLG
ncbi:MAG TPA: dienelactone hydrolase family protein [Anaerolineales bacterium]|nr:dienelactone hydrolase family protein [Anaerolineales bacterium]